MRSLYSELFSCQPTQLRTPRENFLTQALADLLNRFSAEAHLGIVRELLSSSEHSGSDSMLASILETLAKHKSIWITQKTAYLDNETSPRYLDLVLECGGQPLIVIENKLDADYTDEQLPAYGKWLSQEQEGGSNHALILLTRWRPSPDDFLNREGESYGNGFRSVYKWSALHRWLKNELPRIGGSQECIFLANEFVQFLEDEKMSNALSMADLALAQLSVRPLRIIQDLVGEIDFPDRQTRNRFGNQRHKEFERPTVRWSFWIESNVENKWWTAWGLALESADLWGIPFEVSQPTAFVIVGSENKPIPMISFKEQKMFVSLGWKFFEDRAEKRVSVARLLSDEPQQIFQDAYRQWTQKALVEAANILKGCSEIK